MDVYDNFSAYRKLRNKSRNLFKEKEHKFLKSIESLGMEDAKNVDAKRENANVDGDTAMGTMLQFGSTLTKEFAKSYLMKQRLIKVQFTFMIWILCLWELQHVVK